MFYFIFISLGITLLELASDLDLPRGGHTWHQLRNGQLPDVFTQGSLSKIQVSQNLTPPSIPDVNFDDF